jgi:hypothetical protein
VLLNAAGYALIIADSTIFRIAASAEQRAGRFIRSSDPL